MSRSWAWHSIPAAARAPEQVLVLGMSLTLFASDLKVWSIQFWTQCHILNPSIPPMTVLVSKRRDWMFIVKTTVAREPNRLLVPLWVLTSSESRTICWHWKRLLWQYKTGCKMLWNSYAIPSTTSQSPASWQPEEFTDWLWCDDSSDFSWTATTIKCMDRDLRSKSMTKRDANMRGEIIM